MLINRHTFRCSVCNQNYETLVGEGEAVVCPVNAAHALVPDSDCIIEVISEAAQSVTITGQDFKGRIRTVDTSRSDPYTWSYFTSAGDDKTLGIGEGDNFSADMPIGFTGANVEKAIDFMEDVECHYGLATFSGMNIRDRISVWVSAPASYTKAWVEGGGPKVMKVEVAPGAGIHAIIPHPTAGTLQLDEGTPEDPKMIIPVESYDAQWNPTGYWDRVLNPPNYDYSINAYTPNYNGTGQFNFYDFPIDLGWFVNNCRMVGKNNNQIVFMNEDAFRCYKGWKMKLMLENGTPAGRTEAAELAVILKLNRKTIR
jgi:hypothetical protein